MACLVCGSLAFDTITDFPGRFADQILPDQVHILNVSFLVPTLRREWGGCAGNIAYTLRQLGGEPVVLAALGNDGQAYLNRFDELGIDTASVLRVADDYTAQAIIITDRDNNQITAFHPGAMQRAHEIGLPARQDMRLAIIGPDGREAMLRRARDLHAAGIPFVFDPGQGLPMFNGEELKAFIAQATWVAVNDYEARMLCDRVGQELADISRSHLAGLVVTLGDQGADVWVQGERQRVPGVTASALVDPTGCGDAFRGGLLFGLEQGWPLARCVELGNRLGALKIAHRGGQNHPIERAALSLG
ncbi:carbohydrate kinase family protein [Ideonella dechloratans]|uniref:Carbohydrate kinase family protein n=1 Tax=Ideonella dechloratans TaxID=36863 RepID=A0A643FHK3_IDEDE|nr:carbohydrate kinase family protein [Ideonella dechloratans]KAB0585439.1 carbohydrate kinase family protein [Ideonella dechloratans]UFU09390.1 carbohydrate kinase family protein [Ideonella dechloratans]